MVTLSGRAEVAVVWLFCTAVQGCVREEEVIRRLSGHFAAWKVSECLRDLERVGVAMPVTGCREHMPWRCWQVSAESWKKLDPFEPPEIEPASWLSRDVYVSAR